MAELMDGCSTSAAPSALARNISQLKRSRLCPMLFACLAAIFCSQCQLLLLVHVGNNTAKMGLRHNVPGLQCWTLFSTNAFGQANKVHAWTWDVWRKACLTVMQADLPYMYFGVCSKCADAQLSCALQWMCSRTFNGVHTIQPTTPRCQCYTQDPHAHGPL